MTIAISRVAVAISRMAVAISRIAVAVAVSWSDIDSDAARR
jgi:hypothetical protein